MKSISKLVALILGLTLAGSFLSISDAQAKRTDQEQQSKEIARSQRQSQRQVSRVRLQAIFELAGEESEVDEAETAEEPALPELVVRYQNDRGSHRLVAKAGNFPAGTTFDVMVGRIEIGTIVVEETPEGLEGEIVFRDDQWPAGLDKNIVAGTEVSFIDAKGAVAAKGPLETR